MEAPGFPEPAGPEIQKKTEKTSLLKLYNILPSETFWMVEEFDSVRGKQNIGARILSDRLFTGQKPHL